MSIVTELLKDIEVNLSQRSASAKDETRVMQAMLNDPDYKVGEYTKAGKVGEYCPRESAQAVVKSIIQNGAKVSSAEANSIAQGYQFSKSEAENMCDISKEFINTYVQCGRKLPLGGRENMNVSLAIKRVPAQDKKLPNKGISGATNKDIIKIPAHNTIKSQGGCPKWLRKK